MSGPVDAVVVRPAPLPLGERGKRFAPGYDPRRGGRLSKAEREFRKALKKEHIPRASELLREMYVNGMNGDVKAAELFFKVCGLIRKPTDDAAIRETAQKLVDGMLAAYRAQSERP